MFGLFCMVNPIKITVESPWNLHDVTVLLRMPHWADPTAATRSTSIPQCWSGSASAPTLPHGARNPTKTEVGGVGRESHFRYFFDFDLFRFVLICWFDLKSDEILVIDADISSWFVSILHPNSWPIAPLQLAIKVIWWLSHPFEEYDDMLVIGDQHSISVIIFEQIHQFWSDPIWPTLAHGPWQSLSKGRSVVLMDTCGRYDSHSMTEDMLREFRFKWSGRDTGQVKVDCRSVFFFCGETLQKRSQAEALLTRVYCRPWPPEHIDALEQRAKFLAKTNVSGCSAPRVRSLASKALL